MNADDDKAYLEKWKQIAGTENEHVLSAEHSSLNPGDVLYVEQSNAPTGEQGVYC